jgi:hypothetical protein
LVRGYLVGALVLVALGGCSSSGGSSSAATAAPSSTGTPWVLYSAGSPAPTVGAPIGAAATRSTMPTGFLPLPSTTATATPTPSPSCVPANARGAINGADVVPSRTSAAVTFYNPGGEYLVQYRVTAISQDLVTGNQRDVGWTVVTPGAACGYITATVTGLDPKTHYQFSVDAVTRKLGSDGTEAATVARSRIVSTT